MTSNSFGLALALLGGVALMQLLACDNPTKTGPVNDVVFFGRSAGSYELCFFVQEDFTSLQPSTACDREGTTPIAFAVEAVMASDGEGEPCSFAFAVDEAIPITEDGSFELELRQSGPGGATITRRLNGQINVDSGFDSASGSAEEEVLDGEEATLCELSWNATDGPVCRESEFARCQLLADCCDSIYLLPPVQNECQQVVDSCDPDSCDALLAGYLGCAQPPICPLAEDPLQVCTALNDCCLDVAPLSKEEIEACVELAQQCNALACGARLNQEPACAPDP